SGGFRPNREIWERRWPACDRRGPRGVRRPREGDRSGFQTRGPGAFLAAAARAGGHGPRAPRPLPEEVSLPRELGGEVPRTGRSAIRPRLPRLRGPLDRPEPPHPVPRRGAGRLPSTGRRGPENPTAPVAAALGGSGLQNPGDAFPAKRLACTAHPGKIDRPNVDPLEAGGVPHDRLPVLQGKEVDDESGMNGVEKGGKDLRETAVVPPAIQLAEQRRRLGHRQGVRGDRVARGHQSPESRGDDDFDVRGAVGPRFLGDAHVHVTLEATIRGKESTGTHGTFRALVEDFLP